MGLGVVVETERDVLRWKCARGMRSVAEQISDRVVVFGARQEAQRRWARIGAETRRRRRLAPGVAAIQRAFDDVDAAADSETCRDREEGTAAWLHEVTVSHVRRSVNVVAAANRPGSSRVQSHEAV